MANLQQLSRIVVFAYITYLPIFCTLWCITVLPTIVSKNFGYHSVENQTTIASYFFTSFFYGLILGSFVWPYLVQLSSKRNSIFVALIFQFIFNALQYYYENIYWLCFSRFIVGFMHNLNSVGKDFIFEFANKDHRQYAFSLKSCFGMIAAYVGPFIGYYIYEFSNQDFKLSCFYVSFYFYLPALILFVVLFYLNYDPQENEKYDQDTTLMDRNEFKQNKSRGLFGVFKYCFENKEIKGYIIIYIIAHSTFKAATMAIIFFMEQNWQQGGLGLSTKSVSIINLISYFPSAFILLYSPQLIPKKFSYQNYIKLIVYLLASCIIFIPILRDLFTYNFIQKFPYFVYGNLILFNSFSPRVFSPFINYILNHKISKFDRTSINSVLIISSTFASSILINILSTIYAYTLGSPYFIQFQPFNKYVPFIALSILLIFGQSFIVKNKQEISL